MVGALGAGGVLVCRADKTCVLGVRVLGCKDSRRMTGTDRCGDFPCACLGRIGWETDDEAQCKLVSSKVGTKLP